MTVAEILALVRRQTKTTTTMISDADLLVYLNIVYIKLHRMILDLDKDYFVREWISNTTANISTYSLLEPDASAETYGQGKIERLDIKYADDDDFYTPVDLKAYDHFMQKDTIAGFDNLDRLLTEQSKSCPFALIKGRTIQIYPQPDVSVTNGLKLTASKKPYKVDAADTESELLVPEEYQDLIAMGIQKYIYRERNLIGEKNDSINEYNIEVSRMLSNLASVKTTIAVSSSNESLHRFH